MIYCVDTSAWLDGWVRDYPPDVFPSMWVKIEELIAGGVIVSSEEVYVELAKKSDGIHTWIKARKTMLIPLTDEIQEAAIDMLGEFPRLVDTIKGRSQADPFVIASAAVLGATVVTGENFTNNMEKPKIPDVCRAREIPCITFLEMLRALGWSF